MKPVIGILSSIGILSTALIVAFVQPAIAQVQSNQPLTERTVLERLFTAPEIQAEWFAPEFLAQVPLSELQQGRIDLQQEFGSYQDIEEESNTFVVIFERGRFDATLNLNENGQIIGLLLDNFR
ncbi:MAG: hypothetical protein HC865_21060 [Cyanobacteria bacterium RU_5_0]|nr:hypothetical protein [Cyanobacteria bacterium RU_5_0]